MGLRDGRAKTWLRLGIEDVNGLFLSQSAGAHAFRTRPLGELFESVNYCGALVIMCNISQELAIELANVASCGAREFYSIRKKSIKYRL
jgi:hypothetical protein